MAGNRSAGSYCVMQYDYPLIMGITMFTALLVVLGNLLADILYAVFDPRIRKAGC